MIADAGVLVSLALFTLAAWGVFRSKWWWNRAALAGAIAGLATLVPYWIAASSTPEPGLNKPIHIVGSAAVLANSIRCPFRLLSGNITLAGLPHTAWNIPGGFCAGRPG